MVVLQLVLDSVEWHLTVVEARHAWKRVPRDGSRTKETQRRWAACSRVVQHITDRIVQPAPIVCRPLRGTGEMAPLAQCCVSTVELPSSSSKCTEFIDKQNDLGPCPPLTRTPALRSTASTSTTPVNVSGV